MSGASKPKQKAMKLPRSLEPEEVELLLHPFREVKDPRDRTQVKYGLFEIIIMALSAVISGAEGFIAIASWADSYSEWLSEFLDLPQRPVLHGPLHTTAHCT